MSDRPEVSVVVPARDAAASLTALLDALSAQTVPQHRFEVIVVDDGSSDATLALLHSRGDVRVVKAPGHVGIAASRNLGVRAAVGAVLAFVDADCIPAPSWIERGLEALARLDADILAGHIEVTAKSPSPAALLDLAHYFDQERYVAEGFAATGNLWVRRQIIESAGPFDERLARGEDEEFVRRAVAAGARLRYARDVMVSHAARGVRGQVRRSFQIGRQGGPAQLRRRARSGAYVTHDRIRSRLLSAGYTPTGARMLAIWAAKNFCLRLPMALGALWTAFSRWSARH